VVAIGSSTGGPPALSTIIPQLSPDLPSTVVISQHMPTGFTRTFAERLNKLSRLRVKEAENGDVVSKGEVLIAPGGYHLSFKKQGKRVITRLIDRRKDDRYTPSVDAMFTSAADMWGNRTLGVVLTGMGSDGKEGVLKIKDRGGYVLAESEETCVVFGMPKVAISTGQVDEVLPLYNIGQRINEGCKYGFTKRS
ncbi:MAG: chemotaxis protein CheB, partial [Deltaproteobacteria bacterium]|nr:chemotaxis protein CheB [Deltaproteobacteria bacterium]